jgi:hypothetical protein
MNFGFSRKDRFGKMPTLPGTEILRRASPASG